MMIGHWDKNKHIFTYFFPHGNYQFIAWSHDKCHLHEILFPNLKKTVASGILWIKIKRRILTFSTGRQKGINGVLYESRTGMSWAVGTRAHVSKVKFTSGSRPRSSRPRILRSLLLRGRRYQRLSWDLSLRPKQTDVQGKSYPHHGTSGVDGTSPPSFRYVAAFGNDFAFSGKPLIFSTRRDIFYG